ncbi:hypothetical protein GUJ93_ZPchr0006g41065 [Zizania palustris]|uniref:Uncharacterized protein n=1 Tax=Zizania palustris TaxID=103762 RepID=A0A8J5VVG6_ZIZPA|nr:hypothetical protein GUJ93_ZPchr0006g41065 [Zizania palustris]
MSELERAAPERVTGNSVLCKSERAALSARSHVLMYFEPLAVPVRHPLSPNLTDLPFFLFFSQAPAPRRRRADPNVMLQNINVLGYQACGKQRMEYFNEPCHSASLPGHKVECMAKNTAANPAMQCGALALLSSMQAWNVGVYHELMSIQQTVASNTASESLTLTTIWLLTAARLSASGRMASTSMTASTRSKITAVATDSLDILILCLTGSF